MNPKAPIFASASTFLFENSFQRHHASIGQRRSTVLSALTIADHNLASVEVHILNAKRETLAQSQATAVHERRTERGRLVQFGENGANLRRAEHHRDMP